MQIEKYLKTTQPVIYNTIVNSLKKNTLSHAYLLVGEKGTPTFDVAKFLAKTILCDNPQPLACDNCITCLRVDSNNYPDIIVLDGSKATIKKEEILNIETRFEKTSIESKGIMIYIINLVENMTVEAVNSMLKFLEEPDSVVYAFLTTNNENNVLPTILSRCQILHLKTIDRKEVIFDATSINVNEDDAELLSYFYNNGELIFEFVNDKEESKDYYAAKDMLNGLLEKMANEEDKDAYFYVDTYVVPNIKTKESARFFIDMLSEVFEDLLNLSCNREITLNSYATILSALKNKLGHINESLIELLKLRNQLNLNTNVSLQLDHLIHYIYKEQL